MPEPVNPFTVLGLLRDIELNDVSLPAIAGDLGVSPSQGTWVITSFGVANAISAITI